MLRHAQRFLLLRSVLIPFPVPDLRQVLIVFVDVLIVLDELVMDHLLQVGPLGAQLRQAIHHILHQVEPVQFVLYPDVKSRRDRALFHIAPDVQVAVGPAVGQAMD